MAQDARAGRCSAGRPRLGGAGDASVAGDGRCGVHRACSFSSRSRPPDFGKQTAERPPADATHRSFYLFVNNPLLAHPAGSNWPAPAGAPCGRAPARSGAAVPVTRRASGSIYLKNTHRLTVKQSRLVPGPGGVGEVWRVTGGPLARSVVCRGRLKDSPCE